MPSATGSPFPPTASCWPPPDDGTVRLWDVASGTELRCWENTDDFVVSLAFSPDGKLMASGGTSEVRLWRVETGKELRRLRTVEGTIYTVRFSPDGKQLLSATEAKAVQWWDVATGKELHQVRAGLLGAAPPGSGRPCSAGTRLKCGTCRGEIACGGSRLRDSSPGPPCGPIRGSWWAMARYWWPRTRTRSVSSTPGPANLGSDLPGHSGRVMFVGFSSDDRRLISVGDDTVRYWDVQTGKETQRVTGNGSWASSAALSPGRRTLAWASQEGLPVVSM